VIEALEGTGSYPNGIISIQQAVNVLQESRSNVGFEAYVTHSIFNCLTRGRLPPLGFPFWGPIHQAVDGIQGVSPDDKTALFGCWGFLE
jgi:hypothetical protein